MASLLAAARVLVARAPALRGTVKLVFQPAEEGFGGAREMIADGVLEDKVGGARVDMVFGIHIWSYLPVGTVSVTAGPFMAASDRFDITVRGKGGHGAHPQGTVDAIVEAAQLVMALQTVVSRSRDPLDAAVITCGSIHGGHGYNIIADEVIVSGTARSFTAETQEVVRTRMGEICAGTALTYGGEIELNYKYGYPATINSHAPSVAAVRAVGAAVVGADRAALECKTCGAEDFSYFLQQRPGAFFFVGAALPGEQRPHHKSVFDFDEDALLVSAAMFLGIVDHYLGDGAAKAE
jgi:amidohydrolase